MRTIALITASLLIAATPAAAQHRPHATRHATPPPAHRTVLAGIDAHGQPTQGRAVALVHCDHVWRHHRRVKVCRPAPRLR